VFPTDINSLTRDIKSRIAMAKSALKRKIDFFHRLSGLKFSEETSQELHLEHKTFWC
jgi:hypothetical protein